MFLWNSLAFSMIQRMLAIWFLVPLPFLNAAWTSGSSQFMYYWSLAWRILTITLLVLWDECHYAVVWTFLALLSLGLEWKLIFSSPVATAEFSNLLAYWVQHIHSIILRIWNSSTGIPSPPLALFVVMLPKAHLTSHSRMSGSRWVISPSWLSGSWRFFCIVLLCIVATSS